MKPSEILKIAEERIRTAWGQGDFSWRPGTWCAVEATTEIDDHPTRRYEFVADCYVEEILEGKSIVNWNDRPGRTREEVIEVFQKARKLAEARGE
jgi:hypothetical protein